VKGNQCLCSRSSSIFGFLIKIFLVVMSLNWFRLDASQKLPFDVLQEKVDWVSRG